MDFSSLLGYIYVSGDLAATLTNIVLFAFVMLFVSIICSLLGGLRK